MTQDAISSSQGRRSSSVSGWPIRIFSTLLDGWRSSPSTKSQPSRSTRIFATVDFPQPDAPIRTMTLGSATPATVTFPARFVLRVPTAAQLRLSRGRHPTVDVQRLADHVAGLGGGEEHVRRSQFGRLTGAAQRGLLAELRQLLLRLAAGGLQAGSRSVPAQRR